MLQRLLPEFKIKFVQQDSQFSPQFSWQGQQHQFPRMAGGHACI
jgi:hypothetical protein